MQNILCFFCVCVLFLHPSGEKGRNNPRDIIHIWCTSIQGKVLKYLILALPEIHLNAAVLSILQCNLSKKRKSSVMLQRWSFTEQMVPAPVCGNYLSISFFCCRFATRGPAAHESRRPRHRRRTSVSRRRDSTWRRGRWLPRPCAFHANRSNFGDARQPRLRHCAELSRARKGRKKKTKRVNQTPNLQSDYVQPPLPHAATL